MSVAIRCCRGIFFFFLTRRDKWIVRDKLGYSGMFWFLFCLGSCMSGWGAFMAMEVEGTGVSEVVCVCVYLLLSLSMRRELV